MTFVVSHTHWDREWYHTAERFRQQLVDLIDELLDQPGEGSFLLDGQTVVLEDYLDVRPERAGELAAALKAGKLEAGPWFVLPDELIPSGEGLVRNLLAGVRTMRALRAESPPVLYCPDSFGHPAALPMIARGFDKSLVIVWRGRRGDTDAFRWSFGENSVTAYHLSPSGYELGANLPTGVAAARDRWARLRSQLEPRAATGAALLLNGADHHARQRDLGPALDSLRAAAAPDEVRHTTLGDFARALLGRAAATRLGEHHGELRDSYGYTWTLQGTLASRAEQKRRYAQCERQLLRDVEPWLAMVRLGGGQGRRHLARAAWRSLLLCQPHDSLCGCSIDAVARAVSARLESTESQALGLRQDALATLVGHDAEAARVGPPVWRPALLIRNRAARTRSGVALIDVVEKLADVPVGLGSSIVTVAPAVRPTGMSPFGQVLESTAEFERTESPRAYPDNDAVRRSRIIAVVQDVPALGVRCVPLDLPPGGAAAAPASAVTVAGRKISNGVLALTWDARGRVTVKRQDSRRAVAPLLSWESQGDVGDLYTPAIRGKPVKARHVRSRVTDRGPIRATLEQEWEVRRAEGRIDITVRFSLDSGAPFARVEIVGENHATDHRLRAVFKGDVKYGTTVADAAFAVVERHAPNVDARAARMERAVTTAPLHRYVSRFDSKKGMTLYSDGLAEYESLEDAIAVTLVRAVGEVSRNNLPERRGHAGWPVAAPEAQCQGPFAASFAVMLHGPRSDETTDEIERTADDVLLPLAGETLRSALRRPDDANGPELLGGGLAFSAVKESDDGEWVVLRCVNLLDRNVAGAWKLRRLREARMSRLDETPGEPMAVQDGRVEFTARGREVLTILVR